MLVNIAFKHWMAFKNFVERDFIHGRVIKESGFLLRRIRFKLLNIYF